jgi:hypothetical protein
MGELLIRQHHYMPNGKIKPNLDAAQLSIYSIFKLIKDLTDYLNSVIKNIIILGPLFKEIIKESFLANPK